MNSSPRVRRAERRHAVLAAAGLLLCLVTVAPGTPGTAQVSAMSGTPDAGASSGARDAAEKTARQSELRAPVSAASPPPEPAHAPQRLPDTAEDAITIRNNAPGYEGFAGTWRDPATGDIITSVIAPRRPQEQTQQPPIYIAPQIEPDWPGGTSGLRPGWTPGGNPGWTPGGSTGWNPGWTPGGNPGWNPALPPPGLMPPANPPSGPPSVRPPLRPPLRPPSPSIPATPPSAGRPDFRPPQPPATTPGALPLPETLPPPSAPGGPRPPAPGAGSGTAWPPAHWQGTSGWQPGVWRPWEQPGFTDGPKSWTPGQPPRGGWRPRSWSPWPRAEGAWPRNGYGMGGAPRGFVGMPPMPGNISPHLGPVAPRVAGGGR